METLNELVEHINNPFIAAIVMILGYFLYLTKDAWKTAISKLKFPSKKQYEINDLVKHDLFNELNSYKNIRYKFETHGEFDRTKTRIFKDFLEMKIDSTISNMKMISEVATKDMTRVDLKLLINDCFNACNCSLEKKLHLKFKEKGLKEEDAQAIMAKFYEIRQSSMDKYGRRIDSIFACDFYQSNYNIILALYEVIAFEIEDVVEHGRDTFEDINGTFYDLPYE